MARVEGVDPSRTSFLTRALIMLRTAERVGAHFESTSTLPAAECMA
jgi:hypothetical protein